jgi:outer membrane immunogenic protein
VTASFEQKLAWFATLRGRLGVLVAPTWLAYVTGGLAIGHIETEGVLSGFTAASAPTSAAFGYDKTKLGWTVGGGVEGRISGNWTAKLEYIYADYGSVSGTGLLTTNVIPLRAEFNSKVTDHVLRVGVNYRWGPTPVVARY